MTINIITFFGGITCAALLIFLGNSFIHFKVKHKYNEDEMPLTIPILKATIYICGSLLIASMINSYQLMLKILPGIYTGNALITKSLFYFSLYTGITILAYIISIWLTVLMFGIVTKGKNIIIECVSGRTGMALCFCAMLLAISISAQHCLSPILESFIPYPTIPIYR